MDNYILHIKNKKIKKVFCSGMRNRERLKKKRDGERDVGQGNLI